MKTIVVIDDNPMVSKAIKRVLDKIPGVTVKTFNDPVRALEQFEQLRPDLVIVDYYMEEMLGEDVIDILRDTYCCCSPKILGISGHTDSKKGLRKADLILKKPFSWEQLIEAVRSLL